MTTHDPEVCLACGLYSVARLCRGCPNEPQGPVILVVDVPTPRPVVQEVPVVLVVLPSDNEDWL